MPFVKGQPSANPKGRPKGARDRLTKDTQAILARIIEDNAETAGAMLDELKAEPKYWVDAYCKLAEYVVPKRNRTEMTGANGDPLKITIETLASREE